MLYLISSAINHGVLFMILSLFIVCGKHFDIAMYVRDGPFYQASRVWLRACASNALLAT